MANEFANMSDGDLNDLIFSSGESNDSVSPTIDATPSNDTADEANDVGYSAESDGDQLETSTTDDEQTDDNVGDTSEEADETEPEDTSNNEDKATETGTKKPETATVFQPLKANGKEYPIDSIEELYKLASAGVGAQSKFQAIAHHRKSIMAAESAGVDLMESVNFLANYKADPVGTIRELLRSQNVDPLDLDMDLTSKATKDYSVSDFEVQYNEIVGKIGDSPKFVDVQNVILHQWDEKSKSLFFENPNMIEDLHNEMQPLPGTDKSMWDLVTPIAEKLRLSGDKRSDYDVYMDARGRKLEEFRRYENDAKKVTPPSKPNVNAQKKAAAPTKGKGAGVKSLDFAAMSDSELDAFLAKTN